MSDPIRTAQQFDRDTRLDRNEKAVQAVLLSAWMLLLAVIITGLGVLA